MSRYIDADKLIERLLKLKVVTDDMYGMGIARGIERAETAIEMQPTADVVEVRHGRWIRVESSDMATGIANKCSECDKMRYGSWLPPYCSICGAKMDGERSKKDGTVC